MRVQLDARETFFFDLVECRFRLRLRFLPLLHHALLIWLALLSASTLLLARGCIKGSRAAGCGATEAIICLLLFGLLCSKLLPQRQRVFKGLVLPLSLIEIVLVLLEVALQVLPVRFNIIFELTDMPVGVIELVHRNDAEIISPEERLYRLLVV